MKVKMKKTGIIILFLVAFSFLFVQYLNTEKEPDYCKYVDQVTGAFKTSVKKKYQLTATMQGGSFMDQIKTISIFFQTSNKEYSVTEARGLIVSCVEEYLERINGNEKVRPFLEHYPFKEGGVEFQITFYEKPLVRVKQEYICTVGIVNEKVYYYVYDHEIEKSVIVYEEPYEEALKKVKDAGLLTYDLDFKNKSHDSLPSSINRNNVDDVNAKLRAKYNL